VQRNFPGGKGEFQKARKKGGGGLRGRSWGELMYRFTIPGGGTGEKAKSGGEV